MLQIGNLTTPALSDNKCVLYAVNLPCLLRSVYPLPELSVLQPIVDQIVETALENLTSDKVSSLDFDLLINEDERITNATYLSILTALCQHWAHRVLAIEEELDLEED